MSILLFRYMYETYVEIRITGSPKVNLIHSLFILISIMQILARHICIKNNLLIVLVNLN